jgi:2,4-dienoyl-CoA reductase-like NADH-dependent reductase (Old Yellow Enzyme family)
VGTLFEPVRIGSLALRNRVVMAGMSRYMCADMVPGEANAAYYERRAQNAVGLIIGEASAVDHPSSNDSPTLPRFYGDDALAGWAEVARRVHAAGGKMFPQLFHVGTVRLPGTGPYSDAPPIGPSGLTHDRQVVSPPMTDSDIEAVVSAFGRAAGAARSLGFDGVEIHGAHGYLIDQFFWERTNQRTDRYGGSLHARSQFAAQVVQACRRATSPDFPISLRFSQWKIDANRGIHNFDAKLFRTPDEMAQFLEPLDASGADIFHASQRRFWEPAFEGSDLNLAGWAKKLTGKPTITVGSVGLDIDLHTWIDGQEGKPVNVKRLVPMLERGDFDLVAVARAVLADPEWVVKTRDCRISDIRPFSRDLLATLF